MKKFNKIEIQFGGNSKKELLKKLKSSGILLNNFAERIFSSEYFKVSGHPQQISLTEIKVKDLGFSVGATTPQIQKHLKKFGLSVCPLEIAPYLRMNYINQKEIKCETKNQNPPGSLTVFSKVLSKDDNFPKGFYLRKIDGKLWLRGYICTLDYIWKPDDKLIFKFAGC